MKKLLFIGLSLLILCQACYDDYKKDFEFTATYFAMQKPHRILLAEEGMEMTFEIGVVLGGKYVNDVEETVYYELDPSLLDDDTLGLEVLPAAYYTLSDMEKFVIPAGEFLGKVTVTINESFINDQQGARLHYVLPLRITDATTDSILSAKATSIVAVQFENKYYGAYWITGVDNWIDASGNPTKKVYSDSSLVSNNYRVFSTIAKDTSTVAYVGLDLTGNNRLKLAIKEDGTVAVSAVNDSISTFTDISGTGNYNRDDRIFTLDYNYSNPDDLSDHHVQDTLIFIDAPMEATEW